jgi:hypothetical protein
MTYALQPIGVQSNFYEAASLVAFPPQPNRYVPGALTDGLIGASIRWDRLLPDFAAVRLSFVGTSGASPGVLRLNFDMGLPVQLRALAWALFADGLYPTLTLHGSNDPAFYQDASVVSISRGAPVAGLYTVNSHTLQYAPSILWAAHFTTEGSAWAPADIQNNTADIWVIRLDVPSGRYTRLAVEGRIVNPNADTEWTAGHDYPPSGTPIPVPLPEFRYYSLCVSVGLLLNTGAQSLEIQEVQPLIVAPDAPDSVANSAVLGRMPLDAAGNGSVLLDIRLSRPLPAASTDGPYLGFIEHWASFITRAPFYYAQVVVVGCCCQTQRPPPPAIPVLPGRPSVTRGGTATLPLCVWRPFPSQTSCSQCMR